jgi:hypothetical protein
MASAQQLILSSKISKEDFLMIRRVHVQGVWLVPLFSQYMESNIESSVFSNNYFRDPMK